jgi:hypothetical protein
MNIPKVILEKRVDKDTVNLVLTMIKEQLHSSIDIMDFYAYDEKEEDGDKYGFWYKGTGTPSQSDWALARTYLHIKQVCEYYTGFGTSFTMELIGE